MMDKCVFNLGRTAGVTQRAPLWRPWTGTSSTMTHAAQSVRHGASDPNLSKPGLQVVHPVKLFWPRSRCFDYLYQDAERLLRNYPVQATICPCNDSSSSSSEDEDGEEDEAHTDY